MDGFVNYVSVIYCTAGQSLFPLTVNIWSKKLMFLMPIPSMLMLHKVILYIVWLVVLFISLAVAADDYFCPAIEIISKTLRWKDAKSQHQRMSGCLRTSPE